MHGVFRCFKGTQRSWVLANWDLPPFLISITDKVVIPNYIASLIQEYRQPVWRSSSLSQSPRYIACFCCNYWSDKSQSRFLFLSLCQVLFFLFLSFSSCKCETSGVHSLEKQNFCCCLWPIVAYSSYLQTHVLLYDYMPFKVAVRCTCPDILAASQLAF